MKNFIKIFLLTSLLCFSPVSADDTSWYNKVTSYTSDKLHDMTTEDITFKSFYKETTTDLWIGALGEAAFEYALSGDAGNALSAFAKKFAINYTINYTIDTAISTYSYSNFAEDSKNLRTLPLPKNSKGSDSYEEAMAIIEGINEELGISNESNQQIIKKAIETIKASHEEIDKDELAKNESFLALLYFITNDYESAKNYAKESISLSVKVKTKYTLPAFIYATSSLYDEKFSFNDITNKYFRYSIIEEPDNPIIPLLFSIYLDRMMYRFNDNYLKPDALSKVFEVASSDAIKDKRVQNYTIILSRYIIRLKLEQQKISSLATSSNETIKNSKKTLDACRQSYKNYIALLNGAQNIISSFPVLENNEDNQESIEKISSFSKLVVDYRSDTSRLEGLINDLQIYQQSMPSQVANQNITTDAKDESNNLLIIFAVIGVFLLLLFVLINRKKS